MSEHRETKLVIEELLQKAFLPISLEIIDDSHAHARHAEAKLRPSAGHFRVMIKSAHFDGLPQIKRHRMVYEVIGDLMVHEIHALSLRLFASDEEISGT